MRNAVLGCALATGKRRVVRRLPVALAAGLDKIKSMSRPQSLALLLSRIPSTGRNCKCRWG